MVYYAHARTGLETDTSGSPSEVYVIDKLTVFKGLSGDEASSVNGCLPCLLPHPSNLSKVLD